jgi:hypothetical protein
VARPTSPAPFPSATPAPTKGPAATIGPTATPDPTRSAEGDPTWAALGTIRTGSEGRVDGVASLGGRYVAWGAFGTDPGADPLFATWMSEDGGGTWERSVHAELIVPCPGWVPRPDVDAVSGPAVGATGLVFAITLLTPDGGTCDRASMISLATTDGRAWLRSEPFASTGNAVWPERAWAIPGGWEALVSDGRTATVWRSTDLRTWSAIATRPDDAASGEEFDVLATSADGTRLGAVTGEEDLDGIRPLTLVASTDGVDWRAVRALPDGAFIVGAVPPGSPGDPWVVGFEREIPEVGRLLVSPNLAEWVPVRFPKPGIRGLARTATGWVAVGFWPARDTGCGSNCRPERPSLYVSDDAIHWVERPGALPDEAQLLGVDGDGRVIAARHDRPGRVTVWRLVAGP